MHPFIIEYMVFLFNSLQEIARLMERIITAFVLPHPFYLNIINIPLLDNCSVCTWYHD